MEACRVWKEKSLLYKTSSFALSDLTSNATIENPGATDDKIFGKQNRCSKYRTTSVSR